MARTALNTADIKVDQKAPIVDAEDRDPEIVQAEITAIGKKEYLERLAMGEEPVTIRIEPSAEQNAPHSYYCAVNGVGAECPGPDGKWFADRLGARRRRAGHEAQVRRGAGQRAKQGPHRDRSTTTPIAFPQRNEIRRYTSAVANVQILRG